MIKGLHLSARSLHSGNHHIGIVANNLANINTSGFKREDPFSEILDAEGGISVRQTTDFKQGELVHTGNPLNLSIKGDGFFKVETENGTRLTRDGRFQISQEGILLNYKGDKILGQGGDEINFGENIFQQDQMITISKSGEIKVGKETVSILEIVKVDDLRTLSKAGSNYFIQPDDEYSIMNNEEFEIAQGFLESSNVNPVEEMQSMIKLNKDYQSSFKIVTYLDKSLESANRIGKV